MGGTAQDQLAMKVHAPPTRRKVLTTIQSRPTPKVYTSRFEVGDVAYFQPNVEKIDFVNGESIDDSAVKCLIVGVTFTKYHKVLYDVAVTDGPWGYFVDHPLRTVYSDFIVTLKGAQS